jgi:DNA-directed RNA polymerase subunit M/transcription elongation factor TFIIS
MDLAEIKDKVRQVISDAAHFLDEGDVTILEENIYKSAEEAAKRKKIAPSWNNDVFRALYMSTVRSVVTNIDVESYINKNASQESSHIVNRLLNNEVKIKDIPFMRPEDIRPAIWTDIIEKKMKKEKSMKDYKPGAKTDMFKCFKCHARECTYTTAQIRSSDEPTTIFVACLQCGNNWRIG